MATAKTPAQKKASAAKKIAKFEEARRLAKQIGVTDDVNPNEYIIGEDWGFPEEIVVTPPKDLARVAELDGALRNDDFFGAARALLDDKFTYVVARLNMEEDAQLLFGALIGEMVEALYGKGAMAAPGGFPAS